MSKLTIIVLEAKGIPKVDVIGWSDPYVQVRVGNSKVEETKVRKNEKHPVWDKRFKFDVKSKADEIHIRIMDHDTISADDPIGTVVLPIEGLEPNKGILQWFPVKLSPKVKPDTEPCAIRLVLELH